MVQLLETKAHMNMLLLQVECQWAEAISVQDSGSEMEHIISKQSIEYCRTASVLHP